jgi:16S rRNA (uracil1498-N3)-methyltransferase
MPRIYTPHALQTGLSLELDAAAARHMQVLRMQPGDGLTLFNGQGGEFEASVTRMGRSQVQVSIGVHHAVEREAVRQVHLAVGMPANERMDWLIEKATELGVLSIQPLITERSVLRLSAERAEKKTAHWQAAAMAACEQCGRNQIPLIHPPCSYPKWLQAHTKYERDAADVVLNRALLSLHPQAIPAARWANALPASQAVLCLAGPEGGLSPAEESAALQAGFAALSLGPRTLRSETAPLAALAAWTLNEPLIQEKPHE